MDDVTKTDALATRIAEEFNALPIFYHFGGQYLLDPNEFNGWGILGPSDNTNSQDLGNVGIVNPSRTSGGISYPFDVELVNFTANHQNSNATAEAWGWRIGRQVKNPGTNTVTWTDILDEVGDNGGVGPRNYLNTTNQETDIDFTGEVIPAGEIIVLGVESPTAIATNYYVRCMQARLEFKKA